MEKRGLREIESYIAVSSSSTFPWSEVALGPEETRGSLAGIEPVAAPVVSPHGLI